LQRSFAYLLMVHIPLVASAAIVPLAGHPLLYLPVHIVWLELIIHPTALLVFQELPRSTPLTPLLRRARQSFFARWTWLAIGGLGAMVTVTVVLGYDDALDPGRNVEHGRTVALAVLIAASAAITVGLGGLRTWSGRILVLGSLASLILLVQLRALAQLVHLEPLHLADWGSVAAAGAVTGGGAWLVALTMRGRVHPADADEPATNALARK
jgi:Ca2+-transporting ATPase